MRNKLLILLAPLFLLNACVTMAVTGGTEVAETMSENRSAGRKVDDKLLYADIYNQYSKADRADLIRKVNLNTRFARVMLTGTVKSEADAQKAVELTWNAKGVEEVINELVVDPDKSFYGTAKDSINKRNLEARLLITKDVWVINYSLDVQNGVAYIIGRVKDQAELDRVLNVCRTTKGISRVVSHLQINPDTDKPTPPPAATGTSGLQSKPNPAPAIVNSPYDSPGAIKSAPISQESTKRSN